MEGLMIHVNVDGFHQNDVKTKKNFEKNDKTYRFVLFWLLITIHHTVFYWKNQKNQKKVNLKTKQISIIVYMIKYNVYLIICCLKQCKHWFFDCFLMFFDFCIWCLQISYCEHATWSTVPRWTFFLTVLNSVVLPFVSLTQPFNTSKSQYRLDIQPSINISSQNSSPPLRW